MIQKKESYFERLYRIQHSLHIHQKELKKLKKIPIILGTIMT